MALKKPKMYRSSFGYTPIIEQACLRELFHYDPETGLFTQIGRLGGHRLGRIAGTRNGKGKPIRISIKNRQYTAHRLAWFYVHGEWPEIVDHINCDPSDNRLCNLRPATPTQSNGNRRTLRKTSSGVKGVTRSKSAKRWCAAIGVGNRQRRHLGTFETIEEAAAAYARAAQEYYGEFARLE